MITNEIVYSPADSKIIDKFDNLDTSKQKPKFWEDAILTAIKSKIKRHYRSEQKNHCCYCNIHNPSNNGRTWDIEHIVSRNAKPGFMFLPKNLAVSCPDCNINKRTYSVLKNKRRKTYPIKSEDFLIFHPHYDNYEDHIATSNYVYQGKTEKGSRTIYACHLMRFGQNLIDWKNDASDMRFEQEVEALLKGKAKDTKLLVKQVLNLMNQQLSTKK